MPRTVDSDAGPERRQPLRSRHCSPRHERQQRVVFSHSKCHRCRPQPKTSSGQTNKNAPQTKQNRHEQSEVPTPTKTLTHGGCLTGAPKARREFRRGYSKAIFDYFLAQQKVIAQVGGSPDTGIQTKNKTQKKYSPERPRQETVEKAQQQATGNKRHSSRSPRQAAPIKAPHYAI